MSKQKISHFIMASVLLFSVAFSLNLAKANYSNEEADSSSVSSIALKGEGAKIYWSADGNSDQGFKVVWSKNESPTYPTRDGDKYHYYSESEKNSDTLEAFNGDGVYYVRVCEYLGGKCGTYSNEIKVTLGSEIERACTMEWNPVCGKKQVQCVKAPCDPIKKTFSNKCQLAAAGAVFLHTGACEAPKPVVQAGYSRAKWTCSGSDEVIEKGDGNFCKPKEKLLNQAKEICRGKCSGETCEVENFSVSEECNIGKIEIQKIEQNSKLLSEDKIDGILKELNELRNKVKEQQMEIKYLRSMMNDLRGISSSMQSSIKSFIAYGVDENTKLLGEGERAAVINSYKEAYEKLPENSAELADAIKIANGRWPKEKSEKAEAKAKEKFEKIYKREANTEDSKDNAAVTIMAYGLKQKPENRKLESEKNGLKIFKRIFKRLPQTTDEWNALQAITYSGAAK